MHNNPFHIHKCAGRQQQNKDKHHASDSEILLALHRRQKSNYLILSATFAFYFVYFAPRWNHFITNRYKLTILLYFIKIKTRNTFILCIAEQHFLLYCWCRSKLLEIDLAQTRHVIKTLFYLHAKCWVNKFSWLITDSFKHGMYYHWQLSEFPTSWSRDNALVSGAGDLGFKSWASHTQSW